MEMCKKSISRKMFDFLLDHVTEVEREKNSLIKEYYSENVEESMDVEGFFKEYTSTIGSFLNTVKVGTGNDNDCPFVIIGSIVEVQDIDETETYQYRIVLPYSNKADMCIDCASCLSPLGKALLLKSVTQQVNIQIPTGTLHYIIKKATVPEQLISKYNKEQKINDNKRSINMGLSI